MTESVELVTKLLEPAGFEKVSEEHLTPEQSHPGRDTILCVWKRL